MTGYPGNIASAFQQAGRAGRRQEEALIIYVAQSLALDQYIIEHPDYLLGQSPEEARIHPDNMFILMDHLKCASFRIAFFHDRKHMVNSKYRNYSLSLKVKGFLSRRRTNGIG